MPDLSHIPRRRVSVTTYLLAAFGTCTIFIAVVVGLGTQQSFERERAYARHDLRAITRQTQNENTGLAADIEEFASDIATDPRLTSLDPAQCRAVFGSLMSFLQSQHLHVLAADGTEVCAVYGPSARPAPLSSLGWLDDVLETGNTVELDPEIDASTGMPAVRVAIPFTGASGSALGAILYVGETGSWELPIPPDAPEGAVMLLVDRHRDLVLSTSANAPASVGDRVGDTPLGRSLKPGQVITDLDGEERIYEDVTIAENGWHVLAGVRSDVALAPAQAEMRRNVIAGGITLGIVFLLGGLLHRRLARPIRRVGRAISDSLGGDIEARAPLDGPSELAHVANAFNDLIDERQEREADLWHRARHDSLTGLPNRTALSEHLNAELDAAVAD
ncbi:MAG: HAMP domain-containing protein, partial [Acidimicrobiales bacterium]